MSRVTFNVEAIIKAAETAAMDALRDGGEKIKSRAIMSMNPPKSGRKYSKYPNRSSAPGEAPARQFGGLAQSITVRDDPAALTVYVNASKYYSFWLEYGTKKMAPRPFLRPALMSSVSEIQADVVARVNEAIK